MVEKPSKNLSHKSFLILLKYIPYFMALGYALVTLGDFFEYNLIGFGYIFNISLGSWLFMLFASYIFRYCYVHRIPLYYIMINDILNVVDYYIGIPVNVAQLLCLHLLLIFLFIMIYVYVYAKYIKKSIIVDN